MCFIDDDFYFDGYGDPDDDFQEDQFEEQFEPEINETEMDAEVEATEPAAAEPEHSDSWLDFQEIFIIGGMIAGQAYEDSLDEKEQRNKKDDDEGGDSI